MKKYIISLLTAAVLTVLLAGCGTAAQTDADFAVESTGFAVTPNGTVESYAPEDDTYLEDPTEYMEAADIIANQVYSGEYSEQLHDISDMIDHMQFYGSDCGRAILCVNLMSSYGAGHHVTMLLRSSDYGRTWDSYPPLYFYMNCHFNSFDIEGDKVYASLSAGSFGSPALAYSDNFAEDFEYITLESFSSQFCSENQYIEAYEMSFEILDRSSEGVTFGLCCDDKLTWDNFEGWHADKDYLIIGTYNAETGMMELMHIAPEELEKYTATWNEP